jgi:hypothetical protein
MSRTGVGPGSRICWWELTGHGRAASTHPAPPVFYGTPPPLFINANAGPSLAVSIATAYGV